MSQRKSVLDAFSVGDRVRVTKGEPTYFQRGDVAVLTHRDDDGDWWGDIEDGTADVCLTDRGAIAPL